MNATTQTPQSTIAAEGSQAAVAGEPWENPPTSSASDAAARAEIKEVLLAAAGQPAAVAPDTSTVDAAVDPDPLGAFGADDDDQEDGPDWDAVD